MTAIKQLIISSIPVLFIAGCIGPNTEDIWSVSVDQILQTNGYARDVSIDNDVVFIAAGEAGAQIWNINNSNNPSLLYSLSLDEIGAGKEISQIHYSSVNNLLHLLETNERPYLFLLNDSTLEFTPFGQYGAEDMREFIVIDSALFYIYYSVIKKHHHLKWQRIEGGVSFGIPYWDTDSTSNGSELDVNAIPSSIDQINNRIIIGVGQLGIQSWQIESFDADPNFHYSIDLNGTVQSVKLIDENNLYISSGSYGAFYIPLDKIVLDTDNNVINHDAIIHFAEDLTVDHISIKGNIAALSLGIKGIALYDVTDPEQPIEKGIFDIGYVYKSQFWGEKLLVCSREGLQILTVEY